MDRIKWLKCSFLAMLLLPQLIFACDKCFGAGAVNTPVTQGIGFAMLLLLGVTGGVLSAIVAFFIHMGRRAELIESGKLLLTEQGNALNHPGLLEKMRDSRNQ